MRAIALATVLLAGCSFDRRGLGESIDAPAGTSDTRTIADAPPGTPDAPATTPDMRPTVAPCPADVDLVACWRFETGTAALEPHDDSTWANDGTSANVTFIAGPTGHGTAMAFSALSSATVPKSTSLDVSELTVELWLFANTLPATGGRAGLLDDNGEYGLFLAPDGTVRCAIGSTTDIGLAVAPGAWTHLACTYDGQTIRLYQDGRAGMTQADTLGIPNTGTPGTALGQNSPTDDHLDGALDDVHVWRVARQAGDICNDAAPGC